jgi:competence protein ComEC
LDSVERQLRLIDKQLHERHNFYSDLFKKSPLLFCAIGLMGGIIIQNHFALPLCLWMVLLICVAAAAAAATMRLGRAPQRTVPILGYLAVIAFACLGAIRLITYSAPANNDIRVLVGEDKTLATIRGQIASEPLQEDRSEWEFADFVFTDPSTSFYLNITQAKCIDGWRNAAGTIRVQVGEPVLDLKIGDYIQADCWLDTFKPAQNPGQFDVKAYLARKNVYVAAFIKTREAIEILNHPAAPTWKALLAKLKLKARQLLLGQTLVENDEQAMLAALLLGQRNTINGSIITAFFKTGLIHILALSGSHVVALIGIVWWFSKMAGLAKRMRAAVCLFFIILFTLVVPPDASVLRASIIGIFFCISIIITRMPNSINTLALSAIILVLLRPLEFYEAGWQLSFICVLGILLLAGKIEDLFHRRTADWFILDDEKSKWLSLIKRNGFYLIKVFAAGIAATVGGAGILLYHFYTITPLTILWTIVVTPLVSLILVVGFLKILLGILVPTVGTSLSAATIPLSKFFIWIVDIIARYDNSQMLIGNVPMYLVLSYYAAVIFIAFFYLKNRRIKKIIGFVAIVIIAGVLGYYRFERTHPGHLELSCLSVGHGQAIVAKLPGGANFIFDAGSLTSKNMGRRAVIPALNYNGISNIEAIFVSHYDIDHVNGIVEIVEQRPVERIYAPNDADLPKTAKFLNQCLRERGKQIKPPPETITAKDARISVIWPKADTPSQALLQANDLSQVVLIEYAERKILLCSDIEQEAQQRILKSYPDLKADVLILPHHGSEKTRSPAFIETLAPSVILCSCSQGQFQKYTTDFGKTIQSYYTCCDGAVTVNISPSGRMKVSSFHKMK